MYVSDVKFKDVRGFESLNFHFERPRNTYSGWTVIVGGNASGKSTVLKGIALGLLGPEAGVQLAGLSPGWIRRDCLRASAEVGIVADPKLDQWKQRGNTTTEFKAGVEWEIDKLGETPSFREIEYRNPANNRIKTAQRGLWDPNAQGWFSTGFGPMRRLSGSSSESIRHTVTGGAVARYVTLFREDAALSESEEWLKKMHSRSLELRRSDRDQIDLLTQGVKMLLSDGLLPYGMKIDEITVDHVFVTDSKGTKLPMREISDGCRGVYATVLDLVHGLYEVYGSEELFKTDSEGHVTVPVPGVVLIDEVEAHLHPTWQRELPLWLKSRFPNIQFIVTTHSPLVAQAADRNGVFLLPSRDDVNQQPRQLSSAEYDRVIWGSAHKTVLGVAFGLSTTRSQWANDQIEKWKRLDAKKHAGARLTTSEEKSHQRLAQKLQAVMLDPHEIGDK
ncbi:MAG: AAA family ATPase [Planctomycetaceae bacterium]